MGLKDWSDIFFLQLQSDVNIQEFIDSLLQETSTFEENRKVGGVNRLTHTHTRTRNEESVLLFLLQFLEGMSEKIKKGIEAAQTDLIKEKEQKEQEEVCGWYL